MTGARCETRALILSSRKLGLNESSRKKMKAYRQSKIPKRAAVPPLHIPAT